MTVDIVSELPLATLARIHRTLLTGKVDSRSLEQRGYFGGTEAYVEEDDKACCKLGGPPTFGT